MESLRKLYRDTFKSPDLITLTDGDKRESIKHTVSCHTREENCSKVRVSQESKDQCEMFLKTKAGEP